jgi:hypothetical protein
MLYSVEKKRKSEQTEIGRGRFGLTLLPVEVDGDLAKE